MRVANPTRASRVSIGRIDRNRFQTTACRGLTRPSSPVSRGKYPPPDSATVSSGTMMLSKYSKALLVLSMIGMVLPLVVANLVVSRTINTSIEASRWIIHSAEVFANLDEMHTLLRDAESWQRGYLLTGHAYYLNHYTETVRNIEFTMNTLRIWWAGSPNQQANFKSLETLVTLELDELMSMINARKEHSDEQLVLTDKGKSIMNNIRLLLSKMKEEENTILMNSNSESVKVSNNAVRHMVYGSALSIFLVILAVLALYRKIIDQEKRAEELEMNSHRFAALHQLAKLKSEEELLKFTIEQQATLTSSHVAALALISEDSAYCRKVCWSLEGSEGCSVGDAMTFSIESGSFWAKCLQERTAIIVNNCSTPHPYTINCPRGHVPMKRVMCAPIIQEDRVVALALVANKKDAYSEADAKQLTLFSEEAWKTLAGEGTSTLLGHAFK